MAVRMSETAARLAKAQTMTMDAKDAKKSIRLDGTLFHHCHHLEHEDMDVMRNFKIS